MIKFLPLAILGLSYRIQQKIKNDMFRFQISVLVPVVFEFENV